MKQSSRRCLQSWLWLHGKIQCWWCF